MNTPRPAYSREAARIHRVTTADGVSLALHRLGAGTPVILAHGTFSNSSFWLGTRGTGFARYIADHGFEACVLDFRGHGDSQRPAARERWGFDQWGRLDIVAAVRAVARDGRRPLLVGHSAGGASILAALAAEDDVHDAVAGAIILATPLPWLQRWRRAAAYLMRFAARRIRTFPARLLRLGPEDELPGVMEQWMDWNIRGQLLARQAQGTSGPEGSRDTALVLGAWVGDDGTDYLARLGAVHTPMLIVAGAGDRYFAPPAACRGVYEAAGSSRKTFLSCGKDNGFLKDYNHVDLIVSAEAQREVWPLLLQWLQTNDASSR